MKLADLKELVQKRVTRFKDETGHPPNTLIVSTDVLDILLDAKYNVTFFGLVVYEVPSTNPRTAIVALCVHDQP